MKMVILSYNEILDYINCGYKPLTDLRLLLEYKYLNNNEKYNVWLFENGKYIDVHGGNLIEKYIPAHIAFGKVIWGHYVCYPTDKDYIVK